MKIARYTMSEYGIVKEAKNEKEWAEWFNKSNRVVDQTQIGGKVMVHTVFLGIDHNFDGQGEPILFETVVFGGEHEGVSQRYRTLFEAKNGHKDIVRAILQSMK